MSQARNLVSHLPNIWLEPEQRAKWQMQGNHLGKFHQAEEEEVRLRLARSTTSCPGEGALDGRPSSIVTYPGLVTSPGPCLDFSQPWPWIPRQSSRPPHGATKDLYRQRGDSDSQRLRKTLGLGEKKSKHKNQTPLGKRGGGKLHPLQARAKVQQGMISESDLLQLCEEMRCRERRA